jgi:hypothetical protein
MAFTRELHFDGGEITILKTIGTTGAHVCGETLIERAGQGMEEAEFIDCLEGLMQLGYVSCDHSSIRTLEDVQRANFQVNSGYARAIDDALNPSRRPQKRSRRVRRE